LKIPSDEHFIQDIICFMEIENNIQLTDLWEWREKSREGGRNRSRERRRIVELHFQNSDPRFQQINESFPE
jgi:hypothetical protein